MPPKEPPPGCFWQTVGRPIDPADLERVRSQGRDGLCEFFLAGGVNEQSRYKRLRGFFPMSFREFRALEGRVARSVGESCTVYVPLVGEGTAVWRPATATRVRPGVFRLAARSLKGRHGRSHPASWSAAPCGCSPAASRGWPRSSGQRPNPFHGLIVNRAHPEMGSISSSSRVTRASLLTAFALAAPAQFC
jgi:hypothetical protein